MTQNARSHRLRRGRYSEPNRIYLITANCYRRQAIFSELRRGRAFVQSLMIVKDWAETLCYVVMPDHIHWLMQLRDGADLSATVQKVKSLTSKQLRSEGCTENPVWQRSFHDHALRREQDLLAVASLCGGQPYEVRAGQVPAGLSVLGCCLALKIRLRGRLQIGRAHV